MKLLTRNESQALFLIGKREREMFFSLLQRYPLLSTNSQKISKSLGEEVRDSEQLIQEALADQQRQNKRQVEAMLAEPGRFTEDELGYRFALKHSEVDWLLQVLNDVRVGSWVKLGSPDLYKEISFPVNEENVQLAWCIEIAGLFQSALLEAINS